MGFYSFYRIFKDIIRSIFGNKAWRITLIIVILFLSFIIINNKVNAVENNNNYVVDYYSTYVYSPSDSTWYYYYTVIPVFANSSYSISWQSGLEVHFSFVDNISRISSNQVYPTSDIEGTNNQGSFGYFAVKDGYLICTYRQIGYTVNPISYTITTDYDFTSNLATIHEDLINLMNAIQGSDSIPGSIFSSTVTGLSVTNGGGNGSFQSGSSTIIYYELDNDKVNTFDFTITSVYPGFSHLYGYCNAIPSSGVAYNYLGSCVNASQYNNVVVSVPKGAKYFFVRLNGSNSTYTLNSYTLGYGGFDEVNQQVINQGNQTRDTLTDSNISQDTADYGLPSDSTSDITESGFASIFDRIKTTFTTGSVTPISITVPFTNRSFVISRASVFGSANLGIVQTLIECFWWYIISLFIVKNVFKKIEKIKTGNIEFTESTNIKEDIL